MPTVTIWRLTKAKHAASALSGYGSTLRAGRWHPRGRPVVYCAPSPSLALLETLVHVERTDLLRFDYVAIPVTLREEHLERLGPADLPADWQAWPHPASTQALGARWFDEQRSVALVGSYPSRGACSGGLSRGQTSARGRNVNLHLYPCNGRLGD